MPEIVITRKNAGDVLAAAGDWRARARCAGRLFWLDLPIEQQLADCDACPVATACMAHAIATRAVAVVQGGQCIGMTPIRSARKETPT